MKYLIFYYYFLFVLSFVLEDLWQNHIVFSEGGFRFDEIFQDRMAAIHFMQILACSNDPMSVFCQKGLRVY